jgi:hypothetical protein
MNSMRTSSNKFEHHVYILRLQGHIPFCIRDSRIANESHHALFNGMRRREACLLGCVV